MSVLELEKPKQKPTKLLEDRTPKEAAQQVLSCLPDDVTWEELKYRLYVCQEVWESLNDTEPGIPHEEVGRIIDSWFVKGNVTQNITNVTPAQAGA